MTQAKPQEVSGLRLWWKSPSVRSVRKKISNLQMLLYPFVVRIMLGYGRLAQRYIRYDRRGPMYDYIREGKPFIFTFWHESDLPTTIEFFRYTNEFPAVAMVSPGRLGIVTKLILDRFGLRTVHGSNSAGGIKAIDRITELANTEGLSPYLTADGSRGPSRKAGWGAVYLAKDTGLPIIACRGWCERQVVLERTWMKLAVPLPWGRAVVLTSEPMFIPQEATKEELEVYRIRLEKMMNEQADASVAYFEQGPEAVADWPKADFIPSRDRPLPSPMSEPTR